MFLIDGTSCKSNCYYQNLIVMDSNIEYLPQLNALLQTGQKANIAISVELAKGLGLHTVFLKPWLELMRMIHFKQRKSLQNSLELLFKFESIKLSVLNLKKNPEVVFLLPNLKNLYLNNNKITEIPESIGNLKNLEVLELANNQIRKLPIEIENLQNLKVLLLSNNSISILPDEFGKLKSLNTLYLNSNYIQKLPDSIDKLSNLKILNLSGNNNIYIDENAFFSLPNLTDINLKNCFINSINLCNEEKLFFVYNEKGNLSEIYGKRSRIVNLENCGCPNCRGSWLFCDDMNCFYYFDKYNMLCFETHQSEILQDSFHRNLKKYKVSPWVFSFIEYITPNFGGFEVVYL